MATGSEAGKPAEVVLEWPKQDKKRMLHAVYRVGDLDRTIKCYTECFGMKLLRKRDVPEEKYTNAFLGFGPEDSNFALELTYNYGVDKYDIGAGFGHFAIAHEDVCIAYLQHLTLHVTDPRAYTMSWMQRRCTSWLRQLNHLHVVRSLVNLVLSREGPL
uniref:VOC domain-containing protein n=2 Tax=Aegilops tauschii subsp. strangulata TaxID=200361 RepID=A0A453P1E1_AEGTS